MTTSNTDDLGIGQVLEKALPYFDFIAPMVYPSHYPPTWHGFKIPQNIHMRVIKISMSKRMSSAVAMGESPKNFVHGYKILILALNILQKEFVHK